MKSQNSPPTLSALLPTYNGDVSKIDAAIQSVRDQTYSDYECIIIDDSTAKDVIDLLKSTCELDQRFRYIRGTGEGIAAALNRGLFMSRGDFIVRLDDTDSSRRDRFELQMTYLQDNNDVGVVGSNYHCYRNGEKFERKYPEDHNAIKWKFMISCPMAHPTIMARRSVLVDAGGYESSFRYCEDLELWLRLLKSGVKFGNIQEPLIEFDNDIILRPKKHFIYNSRARFRHSRDFFLFISFLISLSQFVLPTIVRERLKKTLEQW